MAGTLPPTAWLLTKDSVVQGKFDTLLEIALHLGTYINPEGVVTFMNKKAGPTYLMVGHSDMKIGTTTFTSRNAFTPEEALKNWASCELRNRLPGEYTIYRYLKKRG